MSEQQGQQPRDANDENKWRWEMQRWETQRQDAHRAHDDTIKFFQGVNQAVIENANLALRTAVLINGGAAVAVLGFMGALVARNMPTAATLQEVSSALIWFAVGVAVAALAMMVAYLTNYCIGETTRWQQRTWEHPFIAETTGSRLFRCAAVVFQIIGVCLCLGSLVVFVVGMFAVKDAFGHLVH